ncbi:nuclear transport factor 2 family protein [Puniceibacterium sp. IMCC21224]|uniref:nuclear transport factor 2 family protein n=1 Tax=Puniceibacterium sp. IMCC21224 TaxID=1618204 RepID=UPI00065D8410|nr:nuclear transport factor 2 family protein [Puniceibacterium sp. IMCC21224]KMK64546.1 ketosteroid isomerase-like protein [Puniceibacterium sp. IMCC21224]
MKTTETIDTFLANILTGKADEAFAMVHEDAVFIGSNPRGNPNNPLHGTFKGVEGAKTFFANFVAVIEPGQFSIEGKFGEGDHATMYGTLAHTVRATGKPFVSDWAVVGRVKEGKVSLYHFYEDSEALAEALV